MAGMLSGISGGLGQSRRRICGDVGIDTLFPHGPYHIKPCVEDLCITIKKKGEIKNEGDWASESDTKPSGEI